MQPHKPKICFIITKGVWGGAGKYVYNLASSLSKEFYDVFVVTGEGDMLPKKLNEIGIRTYKIENFRRDISLLKEIKSLLGLLKIIRSEKPDILHLNSTKAAGLGALTGRILGVSKIISTVHGFSFNEERGVFYKSLTWFFSWITVILCHKTIVINEKEMEQALLMPLVSKRKIVLIRNGIEKIDFKEKNIAREELLPYFSTPSVEKYGNVLWFGTIAELHKNKGLEYAIEAVSKITTPFIFTIIGEGEERKNLESLIKKYGLENKVFLLGFVEDANQYLKAFDIYLCSSTKEGLPYTLLEAGYTGLPCVSTNVGGIGEIIENGVSGILVTKGRAGEIIRALEYLIANPDRQKLYGENLKAKVEKDFSLEQMLEKTTSLYLTC